VLYSIDMHLWLWGVPAVKARVKPNLRPPRGIRILQGLKGRLDIVAQSGKTGPEITQELIKRGFVYRGLLEYFQQATKILGFAPHVTDKTTLMKVSQFWWKQSYAQADDDGSAQEKYLDFLEDKPVTFKTTSSIEPDTIVNLMGARWCDQGFPVVTMGEKYFAALAATDVSEDLLADIEAPWKCFMIEVPDDLLRLWDPDEQKRVKITRILVQRFYGAEATLPQYLPAQGYEFKWLWRWVVFTESGQHIWRSGLAKDLIVPVTFGEREVLAYYDPEREEAFSDQIAHDERLYMLIGRFVLNVCLAMSDPSNVKEVGGSHARYKGGSSRNPRTGPPEQRVYKLGKPLTIDCRSPMREYLEGGRRTPGVISAQFLVRGHWRNQPHGPKSTLRRRQWIQPHWKGPQDGPIQLRTVKLGREEGEDVSRVSGSGSSQSNNFGIATTLITSPR
jgi:hypothetical protein